MAPELKPKLEYSDLRFAPDDGRRYELVHGDLLVTPSPSRTHQRISKRLLLVLVDYFERRSIGEVFCAPTDVILTPRDVFVPDLLVVSDPDDIAERGVERPPLLVVEILSPSTRHADRGVKALRYAELGIANYWIVDPEQKRVECHRLVDGSFQKALEGQGAATLEFPEWKGLIVNLAQLW